MNWMMEEFLSQNVRVDGYYFCPHHPEYGVGPYRKECEDRKPQPGMILKASTDHKINLQRSIPHWRSVLRYSSAAQRRDPKLVLVRGTEVNGCRRLPAHSIVSGLDEIVQLLISPNTPACNEPTDFGP